LYAIVNFSGDYMRVNIQHCVRCCGATGGYAYTLKEMVDNLKELRSRVISGDGIAALGEFFSLYVFTGDDNALDIKEKIANGLLRHTTAVKSEPAEITPSYADCVNRQWNCIRGIKNCCSECYKSA